MSARTFARRLLGVKPPRGEDTRVHARLDDVSRQIGELRGLLHQQADFTSEALRRAGWQSEDEANQQVALQRALRILETKGDVIVGPWTGEVGFELLYWIPFLNWLVERGLDASRLVVLSRGGAAPWYRHLTTRYVDAFDLITPDQFRERTEGPKKQVESRRELDRELVGKARASLSLPDGPDVHPAAMYRLFAGLWRKRATLDLIESFTSYRTLVPPDLGSEEGLPSDLPAEYVVAKFYYSKAFPATTANRNFVADFLKQVSRQVPVVLLSTTTRVDEHRDFQFAGRSGLIVVDSHAVPQRNLEIQTRLICRSHGFIGTYGGFSYLAPFYGVRSLSFFSRRFGFENHHLALADRVFDRLLPGGFVALDRRAMDLVEPAVSRWTARGDRAPAAADVDSQDTEQERITT